MSKEEVINSLCWIIINSSSQGYIAENDLNFANDVLDKLQGKLTKRALDGLHACACGDLIPADEYRCLNCQREPARQ